MKVVFLLLIVLKAHVYANFNIIGKWALDGTDSDVILKPGPAYGEGRYPGSKALHFTGSGRLPATVPKVVIKGKSFTMAAWILANKTGGSIFSDWVDPPDGQFRFGMSALGQHNQLSIARHKSGSYLLSLKSGKTMLLNKWIHAAVTWDLAGNVAKLYQDAKVDKSSSTNIKIGYDDPPQNNYYEIGQGFSGAIMELYVIQGALTAEELDKLRGFPQLSCSVANNAIVAKNTEVTCNATGIPTPQVIWQRSGVVFANQTSSAKVKLTGGEYRCDASNTVGTKTFVVTVLKTCPNVPDPSLRTECDTHQTERSGCENNKCCWMDATSNVPCFLFPVPIQVNTTVLKNHVAYENETVECKATKGLPIPRVTWLVSGKGLIKRNSSAMVKITAPGSKYECVVSSDFEILSVVINSNRNWQLCTKAHLALDLQSVGNIDPTKWYRLNSPNQISTKPKACGLTYSAWLNGSHPTIYDGIVQGILTIDAGQNNVFRVVVHIRRCFGYYLYKLMNDLKDQRGKACIATETIAIKGPEENDVWFEWSKDRRLTGHVIATQAGLDSLEDCQMYCMLTRGCISFNYQQPGGVCELNNADFKDYREHFVSNNGSSYYGKVMSTIIEDF